MKSQSIPQEILSSKLIGRSISRFSIGDTWHFDFGTCHLISQNVIAEDEININKLFQDNFSWFTNSVDRENIAKSAIVTSCMRREVVAVEVTASSDVVINFRGGLKLFIPTDVSVVDWQWCLNETGKDPYQDFIIACFSQGEIEINDYRL